MIDFCRLLGGRRSSSWWLVKRHQSAQSGTTLHAKNQPPESHPFFTRHLLDRSYPEMQGNIRVHDSFSRLICMEMTCEKI
jgi:hypothetical protein